ncbi:MAG: diaminopropionate ammonia-lyase [Trueperaceae bacterium]|nr:MAG: diaminopropionate ammonia-lyase [Trueperaceae bacterium]
MNDPIPPSIVQNPNARLTAGLEPATREPLDFHRRLPGYAATPLLEAPAIAEALGVATVLIKDEASRFGLPAYKMLGASWATYRSLRQRLGTTANWHAIDDLKRQFAPLKPLTLVAATDGNHGRAVARVASWFDFSAHIYVPNDMVPARIEAIRSEGAEVTVVPGSYDDAVEVAATQVGNHLHVISDTAWEGYEQIPHWVVEGYGTIFWELEDQLAAKATRYPDLVAVQIGVGSLAASVVRHFRCEGRSKCPTILGVEPLAAACLQASIRAGEIQSIPGPHRSIMSGLNAGRPSLTAWPLVSKGVDAFSAISDETAREAMRLLAHSGIVAGESGAAGLGGVLEIVENTRWRKALGIGRDSCLLFLNTEADTDPTGYRVITGASSAEVRRRIRRGQS